MNKRTTALLWFLVVAATLNGLGHQLQIQQLKAEIATLRFLRDADRAQQERIETNLTNAIMTLHEFRAQDATRVKADAAVQYMRAESLRAP